MWHFHLNCSMIIMMIPNWHIVVVFKDGSYAIIKFLLIHRIYRPRYRHIMILIVIAFGVELKTERRISYIVDIRKYQKALRVGTNSKCNTSKILLMHISSTCNYYNNSHNSYSIPFGRKERKNCMSTQILD